jgi:hypothetical protein
MLNDQMTYEQLPRATKDMLTAEQWEEARTTIVQRGEAIPDDGIYLNRAVASGGTRERTQPAGRTS